MFQVGELQEVFGVEISFFFFVFAAVLQPDVFLSETCIVTMIYAAQ